MMVSLRPPTDDDWPAILRCANEAAPWVVGGNRAWWEARRKFAQSGHPRRHYVAVDEVSGAVLGYGAIEGGAQRGRFRMFVVMSPERLLGGTGDVVFERLLADLDDLGADVAWMREEARDTALVDFATAHGLTEVQRFVIADEAAGAYRGVEAVEMEMRRGPDGFSGTRPTA